MNHLEQLVLFIEGQQLIGAKPNRVLNVTTPAPGQTKSLIPVSCVEHGRPTSPWTAGHLAFEFFWVGGRS